MKKMMSEKEFKIIFDQCYPILLQSLTRYDINIEDKKDIIADSFIKFYQLKQEFQTLKDARALLLTITKNHTLNFIKKEKKLTQKNKEVFLQSKEEIDNFDLDKKITNEFILQEIEFGLAEYKSEKVKEILIYSIIHGMKVEDIAFKLGLSANTVRNHKNLGYKYLKEYLKNKILSNEMVY